MKKIIECVPNFSEGRDKIKIAQIARAVKKVKGAKGLNVDPNPDYNRFVLTFVGTPKAVKKAAFEGIKKAIELIDMTKHKGEHPRMGACDVCPFIPVKNATMDECITLARELGKEVGKKLKIPVYLYAEAATRPERRNLAKVREGEYEGLSEKLQKPEWKPDFGPTEFVQKSGAVIIGAREFLIAYNVNLKTEDKKIADEISGFVRESGRKTTSDNGGEIRVPGILKEVKAMGVFLEKQKICQVSMNLTNYKITPINVAFELVKKLAAKRNVEVLGSEIVGLVPKEAILAAGRFYSLQAESEEELVRAAITNLGLNVLQRFNPKNKIIDYLI